MLALLTAVTLSQLPGSPIPPLQQVQVNVKFIAATQPISWKSIPGQPFKVENPAVETPFQALIVNGTSDHFIDSFAERDLSEDNRPKLKVLSAPVIKSLPGTPSMVAQQKDRNTAHALQVTVSQNSKSPSMLDLSVSYSPTKREAEDSSPWPFARIFTVSPAQTLILAIAPPEGKDLATFTQAIALQAKPNPGQNGL